jgi:hypothetical protein
METFGVNALCPPCHAWHAVSELALGEHLGHMTLFSMQGLVDWWRMAIEWRHVVDPGPSSNMTSSNHLTTPDPTSTERWADRRWTCGVTGPSPEKEPGSEVVGHMAALNLTSTRRQDQMLQDMCRHYSYLAWSGTQWYPCPMVPTGASQMFF